MKFIKSSFVLLSFTISFVCYFTTPNLLTQSLPNILLVVYAFLDFVFSSPNRKKQTIKSLLSYGTLPVVLALPSLTFVPCLFSSDKATSIGNLVVLTATLIAAKIIIVNKKLEGIIEIFFQSGVINILLFFAVFPYSFKDSLFSNTRLDAGSFHPNLLGFICLGYTGSQIWMLYHLWHNNEKKWQKLFYAIILLATFFLMFQTKSRGSLVAFLGALGIVVLLLFVKSFIKKVISFTRKKLFLDGSNKKNKSNYGRELIICSIMLIFFTILYILLRDFNFEDLKDLALAYIDQSLDLSNPGRGVNSGLSGRTDTWAQIFKETTLYDFFVGNGYRISSEKYGDIDNGYLVAIYEMGLIPFLIISLKHAFNLIKFSYLYTFCKNDKNGESLCIAAIFLTAALFLNSFVARYFISVGNPFSLLCVFLLVL